MNLSPDMVRREIDNLRAAYPDLDDEDWGLALASETSLDEALEALIDSIGRDKELVTGAGARIKEIQERKSRVEMRIEAARALIQKLMTLAGVTRREMPEATVTLRTVPPKLVVTDPDALPDIACKTIRKPDMEKIKELWAREPLIAGVTMDNGGKSLTIRTK